MNHPIPHRADLDDLISSLEVNVVALTECLVGACARLSFPAAHPAAIHYTLRGQGRLLIGSGPAIPLCPHTLVIIPPSRSFRIEAMSVADKRTPLQTKEVSMLSFDLGDTIQSFSVGEGDPEIAIICGYFRASYGTSIDLFATLRSPIVEQFGAFNHLAYNLQVVLAELGARKVGMRAMTAAVLRQVLVTLLRRSLLCADTWMERFSMLSDPQIARAFADMVEMPGAPHTVQSLSQVAGLSRSAFMNRFQQAFKRPPMVVMRQLRMRYAANLLAGDILSVKQVARAAGYSSRSSFMRAFRQAYGLAPAEHTAATAPVCVTQRNDS
jgi:AraC-like DNA-binding protein